MFADVQTQNSYMRNGAAAVVVMALASCCCDGPQRQAPARTAPVPAPTELEMALAAVTPEQDAERAALIAQAQKNGWLGEVDWVRRSAVVGPAFSNLDFKVKQAVAWNVALTMMRIEGADAGTFLGASCELRLLDPKTNRRVGVYSTALGRLSMENER